MLPAFRATAAYAPWPHTRVMRFAWSREQGIIFILARSLALLFVFLFSEFVFA